MLNAEEDHIYGCPYCMASNSIRADRTAGKHQSFITDCVTCCRPIQINLSVDADGNIDFIVKAEDE